MEWLSVKKSTGQLYLLPYRVQAGSGAPQHPSQWVPGALSQGAKCPGREDNYLHLVPRLRMCGPIPPLPHKSSWRSAYLSSGYVFTVWYHGQGQIYIYKRRLSVRTDRQTVLFHVLQSNPVCHVELTFPGYVPPATALGLQPINWVRELHFSVHEISTTRTRKRTVYRPMATNQILGAESFLRNWESLS
jgi:hypothetical protein